MKNSLTKLMNSDCNCCLSNSRVNRRHFFKFLFAETVAFTLLPSALPAQAASHQAKALILSCIDYRFLAEEFHFLSLKNLKNQYDLTALAGAALALAGFPHPSDTEAFWDQLNISHQLHHIEKVIIIDHQDCGAYATLIDANLSQDPERELQTHENYLNQAYWSIRERYPTLDVELYFAKLHPQEVQRILPQANPFSLL